MKKLLSLIISISLAAALLTGCGAGNAPADTAGTPANEPADTANAPAEEPAEAEAVDVADAATEEIAVPEGEKIPIRFMYWNKEESMAALIALINERLPHIDFQFEFVDSATFNTIYRTQMAAGEGPDILNEKPSPSGIDNGWALDLSGYDFINKYTESVMDELTLNGKVYSIPGPSWFGGYFYNKGMFEENGWEIPKTYDEFITLCGEIEAAGIKPIANPIKNPNYLMHYAISYVMSAYLRAPEGMSWDKDYAAGNVNMTETWLPYMEKWAEVVKQGFVTEQDLGMDADQAIDEFATGKAAMLDSGPWDVETLYGKNPELKLDMLPYVGDDASNPGWLFGGPGICFAINSKLAEPGNEAKLQACVEILELISTPEGQQAYWENNQGGSSYLKGVTLEMPSEYDGCAEVFASGQIYAPWVQWHSGIMEEFGSQLQGYVAGITSLEQVLEATDALNAETIAKNKDAQ